MEVDPANERPISIPLLWVGLEEQPLLAVNQFILQVDAEKAEVFLTFGSLSPPLVLADTPEEGRAQFERIPYVPVQAVGRYGMSITRVRELAELLTRMVGQVDNQRKETP